MSNFNDMLFHIRSSLEQECAERSLDNKNDVDAVMEVVSRELQKHYSKHINNVYRALTEVGGLR